MFDVKNLSITLLKDSTEIIKDLNLSINNESKLAIIGEEGNGKSTLIKALAGVSVSSYACVSGKINTYNAKIGYLSQNLKQNDLDMRVDEFLMFDEKTQEYNYNFFNEFGLISKLFADFNLDISIIDENKKVGVLSGGERLKLQLIKVLGGCPDVLLFDEPTNDLDIESLQILEKFIKDDKRPIIFVSHDEMLLENTANAILHIERLKRKTESKWTFVNLSYQEFLKRRKNILEKQDQIATFQHAKFDEKMEKWRRIYNKVDNDLNSISRQDPHGGTLLKKKMKSVKSQEKKLERERENLTEFSDSEEAIILKFGAGNMDKNRKLCSINIPVLEIGGKQLSKNISLEIKGKDKIVIIGQNGTGKTTLIKHIYETLKNNKTIKIGYLPQDLNDVFSGFNTVLSFIEENAFSKEEKTRIRTYLGSLKFTETELFGNIDNLSGGTRVKLALAKLMISGLDLLILDEPTRNLSPLSNPVLRNALSSFDGAILAVSHDRKFIEEVPKFIYELTSTGLTDVSDKFKNNKID